MIQDVGCKVKHLAVNELLTITYIATIRACARGGGHGLFNPVKAIDARPWDAISLALRAKAPIFVSAQVMSGTAIPTDAKREEDTTPGYLPGVAAGDFMWLVQIALAWAPTVAASSRLPWHW